MGKKWTDVPAGIINGATQRFWLALDEDAGTVANRINTDPDYLAHLVSFAVSSELISPASTLLELVTTSEVAGVSSFIAEEKFREGKTTDGVKTVWFNDNFKKNFLGKREQSIAPATLRIQKLKKDSFDAPILAELGDAAETTLAQLWELLKKQGSGQKGTLLVNGWANIAYIRDKNGNLWAVRAGWDSAYDGWDVSALSVGSPGRWIAGSLVVSR